VDFRRGGMVDKGRGGNVRWCDDDGDPDDIILPGCFFYLSAS